MTGERFVPKCPTVLKLSPFVTVFQVEKRERKAPPPNFLVAVVMRLIS